MLIIIVNFFVNLTSDKIVNKKNIKVKFHWPWNLLCTGPFGNTYWKVSENIEKSHLTFHI